MRGRKGSGTKSPRTAAERISLAVSLLFLAAIAGTIAWLWASEPEGPPRFRVEPGAARREGDSFHLPVAVTNAGGEAAAQVRVEGHQGEERPATTIDFLPVRGREEVTLVFRSDPSGATVEVVSYQQP